MDIGARKKSFAFLLNKGFFLVHVEMAKNNFLTVPIGTFQLILFPDCLRPYQVVAVPN